MRRAGQKHMTLFGLDAMLQCWTNGQELYGTCHAGYAGSILTRVLRPGDSTPCQELASRLDSHNGVSYLCFPLAQHRVGRASSGLRC